MRNHFRLLLILFFTATTIFNTQAQDIHYSQFYNSPLTLNPAMTGRTNGTFRISLNYRDQWFGAVRDHSPFVTPSGSFDMPIRFKKDALGIGFIIINDRTGGARLNTLSALASVAYHKSLGKKHSLSLGVQGGYMQKRLDVNNLEFGSQFRFNHFNSNIPSGENFTNDVIRGIDVNAGLMWTGNFSKKFSAYAGYSVFHLNREEINFIEGDGLRMYMRHVGHGGFEYYPTEQFSIMPSVIYMMQSESEEINAGASLGFHFKKATSLYVGGYYRVDDAAIAYLGLDIKSVRLGMSYDVTTSNLRDASNGTNQPTGSIEVSINYIGKIIPLPDANPVLFCPRF